MLLLALLCVESTKLGVVKKKLGQSGGRSGLSIKKVGYPKQGEIPMQVAFILVSLTQT